MDKVQKIREEVARIQLYTQSEVLKQVLDYIDKVQEEPVSELWHDSNKEQPKAESDVAIWDGESGEILTRCVKVNPNRKWAYMEDMLNKKEEPVSEDILDASRIDYRLQHKSIEDGIKYHAEEYSFNIESVLYNQLTGEQQKLWRKELERAVISGGYYVLGLSRDKRYKENQEPVSEDLEEAINVYSEKERLRKAENESHFFSPTDFASGFKAGARWQKEKDESKTEDLGEYINEVSKQFPEVSFAKLSRIAVRVAKWQKAMNQETIETAIHRAYHNGRLEMKEQMTTKAIDVEVKVDAGGYPYIPQMELYDYDKDEPLAKEGDKYKVILIKEGWLWQKY